MLPKLQGQHQVTFMQDYPSVEVHIDFNLLMKIRYFVNKVDKNECQWFHTIERQYHEDSDTIIYVLDGFYIPEQTISGAEVETDPKAVYNMVKEIKASFADEEGNVDIEAANDVLSRLNCWSHSHVKMTTSPSQTDEKTFRDYIDSLEEQEVLSPNIMMIWNQRDEVTVWAYDPEERMLVKRPSVKITGINLDKEGIDKQINTKLKEPVKKKHQTSTSKNSTSKSSQKNTSSTTHGNTTGTTQTESKSHQNSSSSSGSECWKTKIYNHHSNSLNMHGIHTGSYQGSKIDSLPISTSEMHKVRELVEEISSKNNPQKEAQELTAITMRALKSSPTRINAFIPMIEITDRSFDQLLECQLTDFNKDSDYNRAKQNLFEALVDLYLNKSNTYLVALRTANRYIDHLVKGQRADASKRITSLKHYIEKNEYNTHKGNTNDVS